MLHDHFKQLIPSEKPDSKKFSNSGFLILTEIIAIIFQSTFCENATLRWIWSRLGNFCLQNGWPLLPIQISWSKINPESGFSHLPKHRMEKGGIVREMLCYYKVKYGEETLLVLKQLVILTFFLNKSAANHLSDLLKLGLAQVSPVLKPISPVLKPTNASAKERKKESGRYAVVLEDVKVLVRGRYAEETWASPAQTLCQTLSWNLCYSQIWKTRKLDLWLLHSSYSNGVHVFWISCTFKLWVSP